MISGLEIKSVEARRFLKPFERPPPGQVRIDHNSTVTLMTKVGEAEAHVEFGYTASYGPLGVIRIDGALVYKDAKAGEVAGEWSKTRKMPNPTASEIHTTIMHACVPEAVAMAKLLRLPPPIPLPQIQFQAEKGAATTPGGAGPEFG